MMVNFRYGQISPDSSESSKFLTSQYVGSCKSAYTKGYALN